MAKTYIYFLFSIFVFLVGCKNSDQKKNPTVYVKESQDGFRLFRHGEIYELKGAAGPGQMKKIRDYGGNSIRTWNTENIGAVLDSAYQHDLTVTIGLEVGKEWWGDDFNYWNLPAVQDKINQLEKIVRQYKDHPALLMWGAGNEVHLFGGNRLLVFLMIDRIAAMIHRVDPNHPVMTTVPLGEHFDKRGILRLLCPNLDILGVNGFLRLPYLYDEIRAPLGWKKPYILSELGALGPWEGQTTNWGAPLELSSHQKALAIKKNWEMMELDQKYCLGSYAFYWGDKYERTNTFMSLIHQDKYETEAIAVFRNKWTPDYPLGNQAPVVDSIIIENQPAKDNQYLFADSTYQVTAFGFDPDSDTLQYYWELRPEGLDHFTPGRYDHNLTYLLQDRQGSSIGFHAPLDEGGYRLSVFAYDKHQHVATHNLPFYVLKR